MILERNRAIRPSSRKESSSYEIDLSRRKDTVDVYITVTHESALEFLFSAKQLKGKKSIHFDWDRKDIIWKDINK